jgi:dTDP-4-amino-4,6-dideoxygalactose transaminase
MPADYYYDARALGWGPSRLTRGLLRGMQPADVAQARRRDARVLLEVIRQIPDVEPLYDDVPDGACPLALPVMVPSRGPWLEALAQQMVFPFPWWAGYHRLFSCDGFPEAQALKDRLLAFPLDPCLGPAEQRRVGQVVRAVAGASTRS